MAGPSRIFRGGRSGRGASRSCSTPPPPLARSGSRRLTAPRGRSPEGRRSTSPAPSPFPGAGRVRPGGGPLPFPPAGDIPVSRVEGKDGRRVDLLQRADRLRGEGENLPQPHATPPPLHGVLAEERVVDPPYGTAQGRLDEVGEGVHGAAGT